MKHVQNSASFLSGLPVALLLSATAYATGGGTAFGVPGMPSVWNHAGKTAIGTSYEQYLDEQFSDISPTGSVSKVWFSIAQGIITETSFGLIHEAQIKDLQFLITGNGFFDEEKVHTTSQIAYLHTDTAGRPLSLAYEVVNTDIENKYRIEKHVFTDPDRQSLFIRVIITANENSITPYILINPHMNNTGSHDVAFVESDGLYAREGEHVYLALKSTGHFVRTSAGFVGQSDGYTDLLDNNVMDWHYDWADSGGGNVAMMAQLDTLNSESLTFDMAVGFGETYGEAKAQAEGSLTSGYAMVLDKYNGIGGNIGWEDYIHSLSNLPSMLPYTGDNGKLLYASALVLKAQEDKSHAGALIASLSIPWGNSVSAEHSETGYRAVWPRDFYQCAMALLALGDTKTPRVCFEYLHEVQVKPGTPGNSGAVGWFLQKTHVDGTLEWYRVQLDQTAMPIMLGWKLWRAGILSNSEIRTWYQTMLKPAAEFLAGGGTVHLRDNNEGVDPPRTQQERWEEQHGYSPSTTAAVIAGLVAAADIAESVANDANAAAYYRMKADQYEEEIDDFMFTTTGTHVRGANNGRYYLRITQDQDPNDGDSINGSNGRPAIDEREVLDAGFLELVRYGIRPATASHILDSVVELDDMSLPENLRMKYTFSFSGDSRLYPGWRRYGNDGYGERTSDGSNYQGGMSDQRGRVWPFFTGERGHYELERIKAENGGVISDAQILDLRNIYVRAMERFANDGLMLPEQVWDGVGNNGTYHFAKGEGTNSATPLAWSHAEYVKLVKSLADKNTWDSNSVVRARYSSASGFEKTFPRVYFRGTPNNWETTEMSLVDDFTWQTTVAFGSAANERFKFDIYGDWTENFGDNEPDGVAERTGRDIPITQGPGEYTITFNDSSRAYTVVKQRGGFNAIYPHVYFRGTPNNWGTSAMSLVADYTWQLGVHFGSASNGRFKFDIDGDWSNNFGDNDPRDGVGDQHGADIPISQQGGDYTITFNDETKAYDVVKDD